MDSRIREALEERAFDTIIRCRPAKVIMYEDAIALLTAEPEPCEDARELVDLLRCQRPDARHGDFMMSDEEAARRIDDYASQVADKRAEELRAQVETLRKAFDNVQEVLYGTELNMGNYSHDDVYKLNGAAIQAWDIAEQALAATEPKLFTEDPETCQCEYHKACRGEVKP